MNFIFFRKFFYFYLEELFYSLIDLYLGYLNGYYYVVYVDGYSSEGGVYFDLEFI